MVHGLLRREVPVPQCVRRSPSSIQKKPNVTCSHLSPVRRLFNCVLWWPDSHASHHCLLRIRGCRPAPDRSEFPEFYKARGKNYTLHAGDTLYIPHKWWHWVFSDTAPGEAGIAVNMWTQDAHRGLEGCNFTDLRVSDTGQKCGQEPIFLNGHAANWPAMHELSGFLLLNSVLHLVSSLCSWLFSAICCLFYQLPCLCSINFHVPTDCDAPTRCPDVPFPYRRTWDLDHLEAQVALHNAWGNGLRAEEEDGRKSSTPPALQGAQFAVGTCAKADHIMHGFVFVECQSIFRSCTVFIMCGWDNVLESNLPCSHRGHGNFYTI
jgi:hypothetical protein